MISPKTEQKIIEALAEDEHTQWCEWSKSLAKSEHLSPERIARWKKMWIPYAELTEEQKEQDRVYARKSLVRIKFYLLEEHLNQPKEKKE